MIEIGILGVGLLVLAGATIGICLMVALDM